MAVDLSFSFERMRTRAEIADRPDIGVLLAVLSTEQALSPTSVAATHASADRMADGDPQRALVTLFNGMDDWAAAAGGLAGSFHPRIAAAAAGKAGSTLMKPGFTFAF